MPNVLLVSIASFFDSTAEIPNIFKRAGCKVDVFCDKSSWLLSNKFFDNWIETSSNEEIFRDNLLKLIHDKPNYYSWILLLEDVTIKLMNEYIQTDEELFKKIMPINKIENRAILSSKAGLSNICSKYGIPTPGFVSYREGMDVDQIIGQLEFPVLVKVDFSFSGHGIQYCEHPAGLQHCIDNVDNKEGLVIQEYITGKDIGVEALFKEGKLITYNCGDVLSYMNNKFSFTTRRIYYQSREIEAHLQYLGENVGMNGFASMQYVFHPGRNVYYLLEVDARTNSWVPYSRFTGHDFADGIRRIMNGQLTADEKLPDNYDKHVEIAIFDRDLRRCVKEKDFKGLVKWLINYNGCWKFIPWYDFVYFRRLIGKQLRNFVGIKN